MNMDRRLLFPALAATAWAQQTSPAQAAAEKAVRARVNQFYQLMLEKKYRVAEEMVAVDSKDDYYNGTKPDIKGFSVEKIELTDRNTRAMVIVKWKLQTLFPGAGALVFDFPTTTWWKIENGKWSWYIDREKRAQTPFGTLKSDGSATTSTLDTTGKAPDIAAIQNGVTIDRTSVTLSAANPREVVTVFNNLPGPTHLNVEETEFKLKGVDVEISPSELNPGEKASITFVLTSDLKISGKVRIEASPLNKVFEIQVSGN
jgi:hypothetical protein